MEFAELPKLKKAIKLPSPIFKLKTSIQEKTDLFYKDSKVSDLNAPPSFAKASEWRATFS